MSIGPAGRVSRFEELIAWQRARELYGEIRAAAMNGPFGRDFALSDQIRRAARSTMANIAEGFERRGPREFLRHLSIANGSNAEVRSDLYCALDSGYIEVADFERLMAKATEVGKLIGGLRSSMMNRGNTNGPAPS